MPSAVQMNVRIDPDLKKRGDRVFARRGLSPSQAVRALYESVAGPKQGSDEVLDAILGRDACEAGSEAERKRKLESIRKVQDSVRSMMDTKSEAPSGPFDDEPTDKELLEKAIFEHYSCKDLVE